MKKIQIPRKEIARDTAQPWVGKLSHLVHFRGWGTDRNNLHRNTCPFMSVAFAVHMLQNTHAQTHTHKPLCTQRSASKVEETSGKVDTTRRSPAILTAAPRLMIYRQKQFFLFVYIGLLVGQASNSYCGVGSRLYTSTGLRSTAHLSNSYNIDGNWHCSTYSFDSDLSQVTALPATLPILQQQPEDLSLLSRPGPKSGHTTAVRIASMIHTQDEDQNMQSMNNTQGYGGEGCLSLSWREMETGLTTDFTAADLQHLYPVKQQDNVPPMGFGPKCCPALTTDMRCTEKRSFRRACKRAAMDGFAWYKGNYIPYEAFPTTLRSRSKPSIQTKQRSPGAEHPRVTPQNRMNILHLNVGGLSTDRMAEIQTWAQLRDVDAVVLTETRWNFSSEWANTKWNFVHSGTCEDKSDGILIMLRSHICLSACIGITEHVVVRLIQIRLHFRARSLDLFCCYQYVDNRSFTNKQHRHFFWNTLQKSLDNIPNRNSLLIVGDFNCSLQQDGHHVGTTHFRWCNAKQTGRQHADAKLFHEILHRFDLTALNSWNASAPPTFCNGHLASRIDFFITRHADSDLFSKQVSYHPDAEYLPLSGAMHIPILCTIRKIPYVFTKQAGVATCTYRQRLQCRTVSKTNPPLWTQMMNQIDIQLQQFTQQHHEDSTFVDELHRCVMPTFQKIFPKTQKMDTPSPDTDLIESKWIHRRQMLSLTQPTIANLYRAWYHQTKFFSLKRQHREHIKQLKKQQMHDLLTEVDKAAARFDSFQIFHIINRYTPKQPRKKIRLRRTDGAPASTTNVRQLTTEFIRTKWAGPSTVHLNLDSIQHIPFTEAELEHEIAKIPAVKSVAPQFLPGIIWKNAS